MIFRYLIGIRYFFYRTKFDRPFLMLNKLILVMNSQYSLLVSCSNLPYPIHYSIFGKVFHLSYPCICLKTLVSSLLIILTLLLQNLI